MGIYICLGDKIYNQDINAAIRFDALKDFQSVHDILEADGSALIFLTKSTHKIKKKAEQHACELAISLFNLLYLFFDIIIFYIRFVYEVFFSSCYRHWTTDNYIL